MHLDHNHYRTIANHFGDTTGEGIAQVMCDPENEMRYIVVMHQPYDKSCAYTTYVATLEYPDSDAGFVTVDLFETGSFEAFDDALGVALQMAISS